MLDAFKARAALSIAEVAIGCQTHRMMELATERGGSMQAVTKRLMAFTEASQLYRLFEVSIPRLVKVLGTKDEQMLRVSLLHAQLCGCLAIAQKNISSWGFTLQYD